MRKETFLKLCGERDRNLIVRETEADIDDLLRLEYLAGLLGCVEVELSMYFVRHKRVPTVEQKSNTSTKMRWRQRFLREAPDRETVEKIYRLLKWAEKARPSR